MQDERGSAQAAFNRSCRALSSQHVQSIAATDLSAQRSRLMLTVQAGTSHDLGDNFAKAFGTQFLNEAGDLVHPQQSSWGASTRLIGGIIMTHGSPALCTALHAAGCPGPVLAHTVLT